MTCSDTRHKLATPSIGGVPPRSNTGKRAGYQYSAPEKIMMFRHLILSLVLLTNTSVFQNAALNSSVFAGTHKLLTSPSVAQNAEANSSGFDSSYKLTLHKPVQDKNFYLLSLFQRHSEVGKLLRRNPILRKLSHD